MKVGRYYNYSDNSNNHNWIFKIESKKHQPHGCEYGVSLKYKLYVKSLKDNLEIIYCSRYYWDKYATEMTSDEVMVYEL